ncbi:MAG: transcription antitermination protein NusB [Bacteroidia bacterium]
MLSRRQLRVKVLQALYSYYQTDEPSLTRTERDLFSGIEKVYDLYLFKLLLLVEIADYERVYTQDSQQKYLPKASDLNLENRFYDNTVMKLISGNEIFNSQVKKRKLSWQSDIEKVRKIYMKLKNSSEYEDYISKGNKSFEEERDFVNLIFKNFIVESEVLETHFEEKNIYWADDDKFVNTAVFRTLKSLKPVMEPQKVLMPVYKDEEEDTIFMSQLLKNTITYEKEFEILIADKTRNWDIDRIAMVDILLLKMSLAEIKTFSSIPVKVSINEYIDISKEYSTPKSKTFINGIIDKLVADLKKKNEIHKTGRGLIE